MIEFIGPLCNLLQHFTNHYLRPDTLDFWAHSSLYSLRPSYSSQSLAVIYPRGGLYRKHVHCLAIDVYCGRLYLTTGCLQRIGFRGKEFMKPLSSSGSIRRGTPSVSENTMSLHRFRAVVWLWCFAKWPLGRKMNDAECHWCIDLCSPLQTWMISVVLCFVT
jgi:hypothetical protein